MFKDVAGEIDSFVREKRKVNIMTMYSYERSLHDLLHYVHLILTAEAGRMEGGVDLQCILCH